MVFNFVFGFGSPSAYAFNSSTIDRLETSGAFRIDAGTEAEALEWGREVAELFVSDLYARAGHPDVSWRAGSFAAWIESDPDQLLRELLEELPIVRRGEVPDFAALRRSFHE